MGEISVKIQRTRGKWKIRRKEVKYGVIEVLSLGKLGNFQRWRPLRSWVWGDNMAGVMVKLVREKMEEKRVVTKVNW